MTLEVPDNLKKYIGLKNLKKLPDDLKRYKCPICYLAGFKTKECPHCGYKDCSLVCPIDSWHCSHEITEGLSFCPICGELYCKYCGSHDVEGISRVTGLKIKLRLFFTEIYRLFLDGMVASIKN
jgi:hypothetical protein